MKQGLLDLPVLGPQPPVIDTGPLGRFTPRTVKPPDTLIDHDTSGLIGQPLAMCVGSIAPTHPMPLRRS